jgi:hypothetical protein
MTISGLAAAWRAQGVRLSRRGSRLVVNAPAKVVTLADREMLAAHKEELLVALGFGTDLSVLVLWYREARRAGRLPDRPFALAPWDWVVEPSRFYAALDRDVAVGPSRPRARLGGLADSLRRLRSLVLT